MKFADVKKVLCSNANSVRKRSLDDKYLGERAAYTGSPLTNDLLCDVLLIDSISDLKLGKAGGFDGPTSEHLKCCHPDLALV